MTAQGRLVIMGSGETAPTMIKAHRMLLESVPADSAVLLDTPYGFQENADDITARAQHYFRASVGHEVRSAGWRGPETDGLVRERALTAVRGARWVFAGPGSPTYALRAWRDTALPGVLRETVADGGTVVFASAAALTLGSHTVPVYEIYKAGLTPYWEPGLDLVAELTGWPAVVIPHYDNAEGGHHDTRFCYLGERRLAALESQLPADGFVLGVDEHTAVIIDVGAGLVSVLGNGALTIRRSGVSTVHPAGSELSLTDLARTVVPGTPVVVADSIAVAGSVAVGSVAAGSAVAGSVAAGSVAAGGSPAGSMAAGGLAAGGLAASGLAASGLAANRQPDQEPGSPALSLRAAADACRSRFSAALSGRDADAAVTAALDLEQAITDWAGDTLSSDDGDHARGLLRSMVVELGDLARSGAADPADAIRPYVDLLVTLRGRARDGRTSPPVMNCAISSPTPALNCGTLPTARSGAFRHLSDPYPCRSPHRQIHRFRDNHAFSGARRGFIAITTVTDFIPAIDGMWISAAATPEMLEAAGMCPSNPVPSELRGMLFRGRDALGQGLITQGRVHGPAFRRVLHGVYADARVSVDHGLRTEAALMMLPEESVLTANSAAWWYGVRLAGADDPVTVALPPGVHIAGPRFVRLHRTPILPEDVAVRQGLRVSLPVRTVWDLATLNDLAPAVKYIDALMHAGWLTAADLDRRLATGTGLWGVRRVRTVAQWTDARSESPAESDLRIVVRQSRLPPPELQYEVRRLGRLIARVDFAWPDHRLALEYDGAGHTDLRSMRLDRRRLNALVEAGWTVIHATAADLRRPAALIAQLRAALNRPLAA